MTKEEIERREASLARRRRRKRQRTIQMIARGVLACAAVLLVIFVIARRAPEPERLEASGKEKPKQTQTKKISSDFRQKVIEEAPDYQVELLTPNAYSRPQTALEEIRGIVIHYTANPGTTAEQNRDYFESLKDTHETKASSHFVVGIDGEIIQCIPSTEISYASNDRNIDTLSIECCHKDKSGQFTQETYDSLVEFTAWLCGKFNVPVENVIRHYDVTGKECPIYYVEHEDSWKQFKKDVQAYLDEHGVERQADVS